MVCSKVVTLETEGSWRQSCLAESPLERISSSQVVLESSEVEGIVELLAVSTLTLQPWHGNGNLEDCLAVL